MPTVVLARRAVQDLDSIISSHSLPADAKVRVRSILEALADFPRLGQELRGRWQEHRVLPGPWRWMLLVYRIDAPNDRVVVVTIQDARTSSAPTNIS